MKIGRIISIVALLSCLGFALYFVIDPNSFRAARLFRDHAVLQRDKQVPVWGWGKPGRKVRVVLEKTGGSRADAETYLTTTLANGEWSIVLKPHTADGPYKLILMGQWKRIVVEDIYFGDVWLCSGQSNMDIKLRLSDEAEKTIPAASDPLIRHFRAFHKGSPSQDLDFEKGKWEPSSPETVGNFSAVGYYFAKALQERMGVPIGLLNTSIASSNIEAWMPPDCLGFSNAAEAEKAVRSMLTSEALEQTKTTPTCLYNSMIYPALRFPVKGILWWQGESNTDKKLAFNYRNQFPCLIGSWRELMGDSLLPFLFVQLANVGTPESGKDDGADWPMLRESQSLVLQQLKQVGQVVSFDISHPTDVHPGNKKGIAQRLALAARRLAYGEDVVYTGPVFQSVENLGDRLRLSFYINGSGLATKPISAALKGFVVAGADHVFYPANAIVSNNQVLVWSNKVPKPVAARYAWERSPVTANLYNREGLPASPFRTDKW